MSENILVPVLGESITEATVSKWLKNEGDAVEADEPIVELETDKVNLEVPSPVSGVLTKINSKDGSVVEVGSLLGSVSGNGSETIKVEKEIKIKPTLEQNNIVKLETQKNEPEIFDEKEEELEEKPLVLTKEIKIDKKSEKIKTDQPLSPSVRKMVSENKIDIKSVKGSGKDGRVLKGDLINMMGANPKPSERKIKHGQEERIKIVFVY
jgi:2-oxoglutarate dehydrogenase E2 component (dihydrolipoamide succinyltransferase)